MSGKLYMPDSPSSNKFDEHIILRAIGDTDAEKIVVTNYNDENKKYTVRTFEHIPNDLNAFLAPGCKIEKIGDNYYIVGSFDKEEIEKNFEPDSTPKAGGKRKTRQRRKRIRKSKKSRKSRK